MPFNFPQIDSFQHFESIDSTNAEGIRFILKHPGKNAIIVADGQTAGRGRQQRPWLSPPGKGLWWSIVLGQPQWIPPNPHLLSLYAGLVTRSVLNEWTSAPIRLKWPNDIYVNGKKISGVLIESKWQGNTPLCYIIGIGINLFQEPEDFSPETQKHATALGRQPLLKEIHRPDMLASMVDYFFKNWDLLSQPEELIKTWYEHALWIDEKVEIRGSAQPISGLFRGINAEGHALIDTADGLKTVVAGDISLRKV